LKDKVFQNIYSTFASSQRGAVMAEIIPMEPRTGNAV